MSKRGALGLTMEDVLRETAHMQEESQRRHESRMAQIEAQSAALMEQTQALSRILAEVQKSQPNDAWSYQSHLEHSRKVGSEAMSREEWLSCCQDARIQRERRSKEAQNE